LDLSFSALLFDWENLNMAATHADPHAHHSTKTYFIVYALLVGLLGVTVPVAYIHFGVFNLPIAMLIATFKAWLVIWYFMHVREGSPMVIASILAGVVTLAIAFLLCLMDYWTR
jgi:cytochrome c oxidase subunit 4